MLGITIDAGLPSGSKVTGLLSGSSSSVTVGQHSGAGGLGGKPLHSGDPSRMVGLLPSNAQSDDDSEDDVPTRNRKNARPRHDVVADSVDEEPLVLSYPCDTGT